MTDAKEILQKIAALKLRLDQARTRAAISVPQKMDDEAAGSARAQMEEKIETGAWHNRLIDGVLRQVGGTENSASPMPARLTARGARLLKRGRELLHELREKLEDPLLQADSNDPLTQLHTEIASMLDVLLRTVQAFPPSANAQLRLCDGLEAAQRLIEERLMVLHAGLTHRRAEGARLDNLADLIRRMADGQNINPQALMALAEEITREARGNEPLRLQYASPEDPARFVAGHDINVAQVMGRLLRDDPDWKDRLPEALFAALVHDVGMARVPAAILAHPGPLTDEQRRLVERHPNVGAHSLSRIVPAGVLFIEAASDHHERLDGTGYPAGRRDENLSAFTRILAICDIYAALSAPRPYRTAQDSRTALTDTLLLADQGALDRALTEKLLGLSFYPPGSVVELSDGAAAMVVASQPGRLGIDNPARPILLLLMGPGGQALPLPRVINLIDDGRSIVRGLAAAERRRLLQGKYPELV
jgi:HD-GYP domain-containing protein (c-di-GMP phosphodiesterase class II)